MFPKNKPVRLKGKAYKQLRLACWTRDLGICRICKFRVSDDYPDWHPLKYDMAHIKSRGANGADVLENVMTLCHGCHMAVHAGKKKLPI